MCGCGPPQVLRGPESCSVARRHENQFGPEARGNRFRFRGDTAEIGLVAQDGRVTSLQTRWTIEGQVRGEIEQGTTLAIATEDGVLEVPVGRTAPAVGETHDTGDLQTMPAGGGTRRVAVARPVTRWSVLAIVSEDTLAALARSQVLALRLELPDGPARMPIPRDVAAQLQSLAICLEGGYPIERVVRRSRR